MNKVLKLQRVGLITPTVVEYEGKVLATNHLGIESLCNLWRVHFGFYTTEKVDLAMTKKQFSSIQQKTLSSVKSVYELFYERNFIPREFEANEEHTEWGMYRNKELEKLEAENAALRKQVSEMIMPPCTLGDALYITSFCFGDGYDEAGNAVHKSGWQITETKVDEKNFFRMCDFLRNDKAFFSKEAAEIRLAELKGENE